MRSKFADKINEKISNSFQSIDSVDESLLAEAALRDALDLFLTEVVFFGLGAVLACGSYGENNNEFEEGCSPTGKSIADDVCGLEVRDIGEERIYGVDDVDEELWPSLSNPKTLKGELSNSNSDAPRGFQRF